MVIKEAHRSYTYLNLFGYATDLIVCNRVIPASAEGAFMEGWRQSQTRYLQLIDESFSP